MTRPPIKRIPLSFQFPEELQSEPQRRRPHWLGCVAAGFVALIVLATAVSALKQLLGPDAPPAVQRAATWMCERSASTDCYGPWIGLMR